MEHTKQSPELRQCDDQFANDEILNVFIELDRALRIVRFNRIAEDCCRSISGLDIVHGESLFKHFNKDQKPNLVQHLNSVLKRGQPISFDESFTLWNESERWYHMELRPKLDASGSITGVHILAQDISSMKITENLLRMSHRRNNLVTKATQDIIWDWDIKKDHMFRSRDEFELLEPVKSPYLWLGYIHPKDQKRVSSSVHKALHEDKTEYWEEEYRYAVAPGKYIPVHDKGYIVYDNHDEPIRMVGAMRDVSLQKKQERAMRSFAKDLEKKNKQLVEFAYILSHHTRSPLVNTISLAELLKKELHGNIGSRAQVLLEALEQSAGELDQVIKVLNSVCDISLEVNSEMDTNDLLNLLSDLDLQKVAGT